MVPVRVGGGTRASSEPRNKPSAGHGQVSLATLRAASTQRLAPNGAYKGEGAANRGDVGPAPPPRDEPSTLPRRSRVHVNQFN